MRDLLTLIEGAQWAKTKTLSAGTILFHGTEDDEFHPANIRGPAWFSTDNDVATKFSDGGRLLAYRLKTDLTLPLITSNNEMEQFAETFHIDRSSSEDVRDSAKRSGIAGWIIPDNYEPGDDILICDLSILEPITSDLGDLQESHRSEEATNGSELIRRYQADPESDSRVDFEYTSQYPNEVIIGWLQGGGGSGARTMKKITALADILGVKLGLIVDVHSEDDGGKLIPYYQQFGFWPEGDADEPPYQMPMWRKPRQHARESLDEMVNHDQLEIYHWTNAESLRAIMRSGVLSGTTEHVINGQKVVGVSMARNPFFDILNTYAISGIKAWRIGFNFQKLRYDHKIQPVRDEPYHDIPRQKSIQGHYLSKKTVSSDETEEFVTGDIYPIWHYVTSIAIEDRHIDIDYHPRETEEWDYEEFDNGVGGMSQEDQELLFDILAGTYFGEAGMDRAFQDHRPLAIKIPVPLKVIDRDSHQILDAKAVFAKRLASSIYNDQHVPKEPEGKTPWPVSATVANRADRSKNFSNSERAVTEDAHVFGEWPKVLPDARAVARYISDLDPRVDEEMIEEHFFGCHAVLKLLPVEGISEGPEDSNIRSVSKEKAFSKMDLAKQPPIIVEDGVIRDGHHRFRVAKSKGATDVLAYVISYDDEQPVSEDVELDERQTLPLNKGTNAAAIDGYASFICVMNPMDFITLTTGDQAHIDKIFKDDFSDLEAYSKDEHPIYKKSKYDIPFLYVNYNKGKVSGHEGRHRAAMVAKAGGKSFPCLIIFKSDAQWKLTYEKSSRTGETDDQTVTEYFASEDAVYERIDTLKSLNTLHVFDYFYEEFDVEQTASRGVMKGSPRSQPFKADAWRVEDIPEYFVSQFSSKAIPTSRMKFGPVKGHTHFKS